MIEAVKSKIIEELEKTVGAEYVSTNRADLYIYTYDLTYAEPNWPDIVVLPQSLEEVQAVIALANREKVPVVPYVAGGNVGGLTIPLEGGIILDLKRMNRILDVNEVDMYALVEPGVTFGQLKAYLDKNHPSLRYTYAFSPPSTGIITNSLVQGLDNLSFRYGAASNWISGLEALLPTGELVKIGSCAASNHWHAIVPFPELDGLFLGWQGATGVITKAAVSLWPKPAHESAVTFMVMNLETANEILQAIIRTRIPDDLIGTSFALNKVGALAYAHKKMPMYPATKREGDEPEFVITAELTGNTENELNAKTEALGEAVTARCKGMDYNGPQLAPSTTAAFPMQALGVLSSGGGLMWVGTYGPMSTWLETVKRGCELQDKYDITRSCYTRIMNEGHFAGLRWMIPYDKEDPALIQRVKDCCTEQLDMAIDLGYLPYKTPVWAVRALEKRVDPDWLKFHRRVKSMMDPNNIMNPGRWGRPEK
ncbi:MAG: FAD-binding oxidoreductase [Dehalococcoidales bacterium]|nr:FAD-binding oxidoreductase [Dehalococcoidales bacterium]